MNLLNSEQKHLRSLCKDDNSYNELLRFLEEKRSREAQVIEHLPVPLMLVDAQDDDHPIVYANPAFEQFTGYPRQDIIGKNQHFLQEADQQQGELDKIREAIHQESSTTATLRNYRRDGELFWNKISLYPIRDKAGEITHYLSTHVDVTYEMGRFQETQLVDDIYNYLIKHTTDMIAVHAPDGTFIYINPAFENIMGYSLTELQSIDSASLVHPDDLELTQNHIDQVLSEELISQTEYRSRTKEGKYLWVETHRTPIFDDEGNLIRLLAISRDISGRKHQTEQQFRSLVENNPDFIQRLDMDGRFLYVNPALAKLWGIPAETIIGKTNEELGVAEELLEDFYRVRRSVYESKQETEFEFESDIGGAKRIFHARLIPEFNTSGEVETILTIAREITDFKKTQDALLKSEALLKKAEGVSGIGSWEYDFETDKSVWSDEFFRICGLEPQSVEPTGELGFTIIHPEDRVRAGVVIQKSREDGTSYNIEKRIVRPDGEVRWVESRGKVTTDENTGTPKLVGTFLDITERKLVELALVESEARATALLNAIPDMVFQVSGNGKYLGFHANPDNLLIADPSSLVGTYVQDYFDEDLSNLILDSIQKALDKQGLQTVEYQLEMPEIGLRYYETRMVVSGEDEVTAVVRDITDERLVSKAQIRMAIEQERINVLSQFVQMASHEFRTPLSVITINLHMLVQLQDETKQKEKVERIHQQVLALNQLIEMQLLMTKLDSGVTPQIQIISLEDCIKPVIPKLETRLARKNVTIQQDIAPANLKATVDTTYFPKALHQLLDNAVRYSNENGTVYIRAMQRDDSLFIEIEDEGIGIADDEIEHLFERFWRKDKAHTRAGLGLGLPLAQTIVALHDGDIDVRSTPNQGSVFTIRLPRHGI